MSDLHRVVYHSINMIEGGMAKVSFDINAILDSSVINNASCGITGALLFSGTMFAQALEGPSKSVMDTLQRITNDRRHRDLIIMQSKPITHRSFEDWSMAFVNVDRGIHPLLPRLIRRDRDLPVMAGWVVNLLRDLVTGSRLVPSGELTIGRKMARHRPSLSRPPAYSVST